MQYAVGSQIRLVVRSEDFEQPGGQPGSKLIKAVTNVMTKAKMTMATLAARTIGERASAYVRLAPLNTAQAPTVNKSCQAKGLKYQPPDGCAGRFQPK